jgi:hypothetical protein
MGGAAGAVRDEEDFGFDEMDEEGAGGQGGGFGG